ncbi:hypothetical protein [Nonomuraea sp. JJY05]|jgi:hypothetical protein|uniref:hypothetical protein n=1 Tax=Nonomuraea sp. JJY05 TaxID=3350255 RepID=UPI00373E60A2
MTDLDALRYTFSALGDDDVHKARVWLLARGRTVTQDAVEINPSATPWLTIP